MAQSWRILGVLGAAAMLLSMATVAAQAQPAYSLRDAEYVSTSKNVDVLRYIVCLEAQTARQPRRLDIAAALDRAILECRSDAVRLPRDRNEPNASQIRASILECGFRPGDGSPDMGCAGLADEIAAQPTMIDTGKWLEAIAFDGISLWAAESGQRTVAQIDFNTHRVTEAYNVGRLPVAVSVVDSGEVFTLVATDQVIKRLDNRGRATTLATLDAYPEAMIAAGDQLWVLGSPSGSSETSDLVRVDTQTGAQRRTRDLGEWATSIVATEDEIWVSHARNGLLSVVSQSSLRDTTISLAGVEIWKLASDLNFVYGGGRVEGTDSDGLLVKINPLSRQEEARVALPELISEVTTDGTFVFAVGQKGTIWIVSATDMRLLRTVKPTTLGASYAPTSALVVEDLLLVSARQFYDADGAAIKDRRGKDDENGAILMFANIVPDGSFEMTERPQIARPGQRPNAGATQMQRPTVIPRPSSNTRPFPGPRPIGAGNLPTRSAPNSGRSPFPVVAISRGGNVRNTPSINGRKVGSTGDGQPVTLLQDTGQLYNGYPWFKVRMANGIIGYQWGGGTCANPQTPVPGTKGVCERSATGKRPTSTTGTRQTGIGGGATINPKTDEIDLAISMIDLFGKLVSGADNTTNASTPANPNVFSVALQVPPNGQGVVATRRVAQNQAVVYSLKGRKGQTLDVNIWSPTQNAVFEIYVGQAADGGVTLPGAAQGANTQATREVLPADNDYKIVVGSVNGTVDYELVVSLEPARIARTGGGFGTRPAAGTPFAATANAGSRLSAGQATQATGVSGSGGLLADNRLLVGTYTSNTATSGNIELDEATNTLTWSEFCGPAIGLTADWSFGRLTSNVGAVFDLDISNIGDIDGFSMGGNAYARSEAIAMPGCVAGAAQATSPVFVDWTDDPQDSRENNDYSGVPNAYWNICESANYDENSPDFNNETAYWDCADQGLMAAAEDMPQYDHVVPDQQQYCLTLSAPGADLRSDATYNACMAQAEMDALESQEDAGGGAGSNEAAADLNPGGAYSALPEDVLQSCQGDIACLDASVSQASRANAQGVDNMLASEFSDLTDEDVRLCDAPDYGSPAFYDCLRAVRHSKQTAAGGQEPGWDRADVLYQPAYDYCAGSLGLDTNGPEYGNCYYAYPDY